MFVDYFTLSSSSSSATHGFNVTSQSTHVNGECVSKVTIVGHGIFKVIDYPCNSQSKTNIINLDTGLLVGDEYFSDTYGQLVRVTGGACVMEVFQKDPERFTVSMGAKECEQIKVKIANLKEKNAKGLEWTMEKTKEVVGEFTRIQNSLSDLKHYLGELFSGRSG